MKAVAAGMAPFNGLSNHSRPSAVWILIIGFSAGLWAIVSLSAHGYQLRPPMAEEHNIAVHLVQGHGFRSPMDSSATAPPSAWSAPIYPLILAAAYATFGIGTPQAVTFLMLLNALCFGATAAGIYELGRLLFRSHLPGLLGAVLFALHPLFLYFAGDFWDGMLGLSIFVWLIVGALRIGMAAECDSRTALAQAMALGAAMGILALTNSTYGLTFPVLLAVAFWSRIRSKRWGMIGMTVATCALVLAPWMIRNANAFNRAPFIRSGGGLLLWLGNGPGSDGWFSMGVLHLNHPYFNPRERTALLELGEPAYNDLCVDRFFRLLEQDVRGFWIRCLRRIGYLLVGDPTKPAPFMVNYPWHGIFIDHLLLNVTFSALGVTGLVAARRLGYRWAGLAGLMICTALPYIPTAVTHRYALPLRALLVLSAASLLWMGSVRVRTGQWPAPLPKNSPHRS